VGVSGSERKKAVIDEPADARNLVKDVVNQHVGIMLIGLAAGGHSRVEKDELRCNIIIALWKLSISAATTFGSFH